MRKLIIVRHGTYANTTGFPLDKQGRSQMTFLGNQIKAQHLSVGNVHILTSTAWRALQSARVIGRILETDVDPHEILFSEDMQSVRVKEVLEIIDDVKEADVVVVVTHLEYTEALPYAFSREVLGMTHAPCGGLNKGEALVIDCEQKTFTKLIPAC